MKNKRKVLECGIWSLVLAIAAASAAVSGSVSYAAQNNQQKEDAVDSAAETAESGSAENKDDSSSAQEELLLSAELTLVKNETEADRASAVFLARTGEAAMNREEVLEEQMDAYAAEKEDAAAEETADTEKEEDAVPAEWEKRLMADVEDSLNVRADASESAEIVGKLYAGAAAEILEIGEEWTKICSGNVEGYVKNEYCVYGAEAYSLAREVCGTYATAETGGLRVREEANTDCSILDVLEEGEAIEVDTEAEEQEGWTAVICGGDTAYVSSEYVEISMDIQTALTIEEEQEQIAEQEAEEAADSAGSDDGGVSSSADDVMLLAALIYCEAGGESYEGQVAVGAVVVNRVQSSAYPNSISDVIYQSGQFGPASSGALSAALADGSCSSCVSAAQAALAGTDNTGGATSFHAGSGSGTVIGNQTFY